MELAHLQRKPFLIPVCWKLTYNLPQGFHVFQEVCPAERATPSSLKPLSSPGALHHSGSKLCLGRASMPAVPAPLSTRATSAQPERGGHWEPCRWPMARREAGAAHRAHSRPQAGEKRVERHLLLLGSQQSMAPIALTRRMGSMSQGPTAGPELQGHTEEPWSHTRTDRAPQGLTCTPWPCSPRV